MKKQLCVISVLILCLFCIKTFAVNDGRVNETMNEDGSITRTYRRDGMEYPEEKQNGAERKNDHSEIKKILSELGMEDDFIERLTEDDLIFYENSSSIVSKTAYFKTTADGNSCVVSEEEALNAVRETESRNCNTGTYDTHK